MHYRNIHIFDIIKGLNAKNRIGLLTEANKSTKMVTTQPPRLFAMRNLGGFLLPHKNNNFYKGE